ncbi:MAG: 3-hydroxyisobutyrate dehydrogenase [Pseudomonadota bacterium]|nr:3-hydroxyisobutyrate dehydrogenase [Pseudomonadota bacterium]
MSVISFIGLGNMGGPMATNLAKAGYDVKGFDIDEEKVRKLEENGVKPLTGIKEACVEVDVIITMLPAGTQVKSVYLDEAGVIQSADKKTLLIDCSTIDVTTTRELAIEAEKVGLVMLDAPVSGGVMGAKAASLTIMVGGPEKGYGQVRELLSSLGENIVYTGGSGNGQVAKMCNNLILGVSMIGVSEAFVLAERLGLDHQKLFDIASTSSGQCWSLNSYCPVPGPVPSSPANRCYEAGFTADMMLKDLRLSQAAAGACGAHTPIGEKAESLYRLFEASGGGSLDFSGIIGMLRDNCNDGES